ncbi:hypothetical protein HYH03_012970 [Edaphochlamys debaryana]|uniref:EF-hand domain-containing protein n=1 Tax=Edaphochlamys debaryana TaxID=47281 RepID=A0A835XX46_9CHLO|nr:hypothetical protein HYH03_012970 [Edaphochlamys debaryana]|eukprot:KAG2488465.1 hypothetical protein HYH03_012970 [Edaphochlamys debaryana]
MRAFREHGVNGQDLLVLQEEDLEDARFKFPKHVQRKVMRIPAAWRVFQSITGSPGRPAITIDQYVGYYSQGRFNETVVSQLQAAYRAVDANNNGNLTFEEFLVGFSFLDAAVAETRRPHFATSEGAAPAPVSSSSSSNPGASSSGAGAGAAPEKPKEGGFLGWLFG